ncbi:MAG: caspase family protein [Desulfobacula sp.]|uniref:caspase family protein n=1 Tax=Desulfobacula sp. TaxID=2593537 RepID=UPI0039B87A92|nr:caspase family protein [Desulfobacula sp.]
MKSLKSFFLITAVILFSFSGFFLSTAFGISVTPISPSGKKVTGDQWLFVIGINTYIEWPRLKTAANDARSVKKALLSRYHFDNEHLIELYDEEATRANIIGKLRFLAQNLKKDDSLFLFYAGHGYLDPITKSGSWIPVESGTKDVSAWISNNYIKDYLKSDAIKAKHILLVSDSCFSGDFFRGHRGKLPEVTDEVIRRSYKLTSRQAITSGGLEPVTDSGFANNSVFTHFLVKALENNQSPFLVPSQFFTDIKAFFL